MTAAGWTDDVEDLPLQYSFAYQPRTSAGEGVVGADAPPSEQQIRGKALAQTASFAPSAGNGSVVLAVHDLWGGRAMAYARLDVVPVTLDTALVDNVLGQITDLSAGGAPQQVGGVGEI